MGSFSSNGVQNQEDLIQKIIKDIQSDVYRGSKTFICAYDLLFNMIHSHMADRNTHTKLHKLQRILSKIKFFYYDGLHV